MNKNFFKQRKRKNNVVIDDDETTATTVQQATKYAKTVGVTGFTNNNVDTKVMAMDKRQVKGDWRKTHRIKIPFTYVKQIFSMDGFEDVILLHFCPWGLQKTIAKRMKASSIKSVEVLPKVVKDAFQVDDDFDISKVSLSCTDVGMKPPEAFYRIYCDYCEDNILPKVLQNEKYGNFETFIELIRNWDDCEIPDGLLDIVGCFLPHEIHVHAGPNNRRFMVKPGQHPQTAHPETIPYDETSSKKKKFGSMFTLLGCSGDDKSKKVLVVEKPKTATKVNENQKVLFPEVQSELDEYS